MKCANCDKELTPDMEIEYSAHLGEYYCDPDCATDKYFQVMESVPVFFEDLPKEIRPDQTDELIEPTSLN